MCVCVERERERERGEGEFVVKERERERERERGVPLRVPEFVERTHMAEVSLRDDYAMLGLKPGVEFARVKAKHRQLAASLHPDRRAATRTAATSSSKPQSLSFVEVQAAFERIRAHHLRAEAAAAAAAGGGAAATTTMPHAANEGGGLRGGPASHRAAGGDGGDGGSQPSWGKTMKKSDEEETVDAVRKLLEEMRGIEGEEAREMRAHLKDALNEAEARAKMRQQHRDGDGRGGASEEDEEEVTAKKPASALAKLRMKKKSVSEDTPNAASPHGKSTTKNYNPNTPATENAMNYKFKRCTRCANVFHKNIKRCTSCGLSLEIKDNFTYCKSVYE